MSATRQLHLGAFMRPASIHTGAWRYPGAYPDANFNIAHLRRFAQTLERAKFDACVAKIRYKGALSRARSGSATPVSAPNSAMS